MLLVMGAPQQQPRVFDAFPYTPYPIQHEFMSHLYNTLEAGQVGLFESPTGNTRWVAALMAWYHASHSITMPEAVASTVVALVGGQQASVASTCSTLFALQGLARHSASSVVRCTGLRTIGGRWRRLQRSSQVRLWGGLGSAAPW